MSPGLSFQRSGSFEKYLFARCPGQQSGCALRCIAEHVARSPRPRPVPSRGRRFLPSAGAARSAPCVTPFKTEYCTEMHARDAAQEVMGCSFKRERRTATCRGPLAGIHRPSNGPDLSADRLARSISTIGSVVSRHCGRVTAESRHGKPCRPDCSARLPCGNATSPRQRETSRPCDGNTQSITLSTLSRGSWAAERCRSREKKECVRNS